MPGSDSSLGLGHHGVMSPDPEVTIDEALERFLDVQEARLAPRTYRRYCDVVELLAHCLNGYGYMGLSDLDRECFDRARDGGDEEAFCRLFGPERIVDGLGEFLRYFMIRKVVAGQELLRAAGTVTKELARWLHEEGWIDDDDLTDALDRGTAAARDLPRAEKLAGLLCELTRGAPRFVDPGRVPGGDWVEDLLSIERVEPGALWFEGGVGPLMVPEEASALARVGWCVNVILVRTHGVWQLVEVGNVYPP